MQFETQVKRFAIIFCTIFSLTARTFGADESTASGDVVMQALSDELNRSMKSLVLEGLAKPYFMQYNAEDRLIWTMSAAYDGLLDSDDNRSRSLRTRVRVGSPVLDNTNVGGAFGGRGQLPIEDDYTAIRHSTWQASDGDYKRAVETLARKEAFLKEKTIEDRPDDFSPADPLQHVEPLVQFSFDRKLWESNVTRLSAQFKKHPHIQDGQVDFMAGVAQGWVLNSEGTRVRMSDTGAILNISAQVQAVEGMRLTDDRSYVAETTDQLPTIEKLLSDTDDLCKQLLILKNAAVLEQYSGPVLFDPSAAAKVFDAMLGDGLCARPTPLGAGSSDRSLERKIGSRILPRTFQMYDDPTAKKFEEKFLAGSYEYDDEGVRASRVILLENGVLKNLLASRSPTKKIKRTTGHGRSGGFGDAAASIGCLFIEDSTAVSTDELKKELIDAARDEGLEFGIRVAAIEPGGQGDLGDPIYMYKVFVSDGHEELIRGMKFLPVDARALKHILAAGKERAVYNVVAGVPYSVISPGVVFEELELTKIDEEFDKLPILPPPALREPVTKK